MLSISHVVGGRDHLIEAGLKRIVPRWLGKRPDLLTVGGEALTEGKKWAKRHTEILETEKRIIISRVVEAAVITCMGTHAYSFGDKLYLQSDGGPIGMWFTATLANLIMKLWDEKWVELMMREDLVFDLFIRYVDDCRVI